METIMTEVVADLSLKDVTAPALLERLRSEDSAAREFMLHVTDALPVARRWYERADRTSFSSATPKWDHFDTNPNT